MPTRRADPPRSDARLRTIVRAVLGRPGMTRSAIAEHTSLNASTVVRHVAELLELGILTQSASLHAPGRPGRPSELLRTDPAAGYGVGLEFGHDHLVSVVTDAEGGVVASDCTHAVPPFLAEEATAAALCATAERAAVAAGVPWGCVDAVGIALHDVVDARGAWTTRASPEAESFPIAAWCSRALDRTTTAEDVSRAFAEAEYRFGAGRPHRDMAYVFIGSRGVGSGVFVDGRLLRSSSGVCGEIGHVIVEEGGPICRCGSRGCLEAVATRHALAERLERLRSAGVRVPTGDAPLVSYAELGSASRAGDKVSLILLHELAHHLAVAVAAAVNLSGAPHVVLGGEIVGAGPPLLDALTAAVRKRIIGPLARELTIDFAVLPADAGARGVAVQALHAVWSSGEIVARARARARA